MMVTTSTEHVLPRRVILVGDALHRLQGLPESSVDCIITSPPYFRLRDYGVTGQLGLENHIDTWVDDLYAVARELGRILVPTGTLWLNLGDAYSTHPREGAPRKSLLMGPERLALRLSRDGWILRNKIVWAKTNTTPSSVRDRLSTTHEVIYLFSRQPRYYFDLDTIRQPHTSRPPRRGDTAKPANRGARPAWLGPNSDGDAGLAALHRAGLAGHPLGKNPGDVWRLSVSSYRGAHFATYPEHLVERMLHAGCPLARCAQCTAPWSQPLERSGSTARRLPLRPTCTCDAPSEPGIVLDPFLGSGTTAIVAERLGRDWLGIELNHDFVGLATQRIATSRGGPDGHSEPTSNRKEVT